MTEHPSRPPRAAHRRSLAWIVPVVLLLHALLLGGAMEGRAPSPALSERAGPERRSPAVVVVHVPRTPVSQEAPLPAGEAEPSAEAPHAAVDPAAPPRRPREAVTMVRAPAAEKAPEPSAGEGPRLPGQVGAPAGRPPLPRVATAATSPAGSDARAAPLPAAVAASPPPPGPDDPAATADDEAARPADAAPGEAPPGEALAAAGRLAGSLAAAVTGSLPAAAQGRVEAPPVPVYPTRLPPAFALQYDLRRGALSGTGELAWRPHAAGYTARLEGRVAGLRVIELVSEGAIDDAGVAPRRYTDRRLSRTAHAANFQREAGIVTYSGPSVQFELPPGAQDRLSWMIQLPAIAQARPESVARDARISMWVSGARGDADVWTFRSLGAEVIDVGGHKVPTVKMLREPRSPYDTRVEAWLDPARGHLPVQARLTSGRGDDQLELTLRP